MKLSKPQVRILREIKARGELYWDSINRRYYFAGNPFRVNAGTVEILYKFELVIHTKTERGYATVITERGRAALAEAEGGRG